MRGRFHDLTLSEQAERKALWAQSRIRAGLDEREHHQQWVASLSPDAYLQRSRDRAEHYRRMSPAERGLAVSLWGRHRTRFDLPVGTRIDTNGLELTPNGADDRDTQFLERQLELSMLPHQTQQAG